MSQAIHKLPSMKARIFLGLYIVLTLLNLSGKSVLMGTELGMFFNVSTIVVLLPLLALYYWAATAGKRTTEHKLIVAGFALSWVGDVTLMMPSLEQFKPLAEDLFLVGLVAFLIAHLFYIAAFIRQTKAAPGKTILHQKPWLALPFVLYLAGLLYVLYPSVTAHDKLPITVYGSVITVMLIMTFNRLGLVGKRSFWMTFIGAALFLFSDSSIAVMHFYEDFPGSAFVIMSTYLVAQLLIAEGTINNEA